MNIDEHVEIAWLQLIGSLIIIIFSTVLGIAFAKYSSQRVTKICEKVGSAIAAIFLILAFVVNLYEEGDLFEKTWVLWFCGALLQPAGLLFGFLLSVFCGLQ